MALCCACHIFVIYLGKLVDSVHCIAGWSSANISGFFFEIPPGISGNLLEICSVKFVDTLWNFADVAAKWVSVSVFSVCETDDTSNTFVMRVHLTDILKLFISHTVKASWWTYHGMCTDGVATSSYSGLHTRRSHARLQGRHQTRLQLHNICRHCRNPTTRMSVSSALTFGFLQCWVGVNRWQVVLTRIPSNFNHHSVIAHQICQLCHYTIVTFHQQVGINCLHHPAVNAWNIGSPSITKE